MIYDPRTAPRVVLSITGASGAIFGVAIADKLIALGIDVHLVVSAAGQRTLAHEIGTGAYGKLLLKVHKAYEGADIGAAIASGSFPVHGMIVAPCSMRTLAGIAAGLSDNLIIRAADVQLKERRKLVLLARETPLHLGHLRNMVAVTECGGIIMPPVPAFYQKPETIAHVVDHIASRAIDQLALPIRPLAQSWQGEQAAGSGCA
nr:UbiX family flavin prenyltransferase [Rhizobium etli]